MKVHMTPIFFCLFERSYKIQKNGVFLFEGINAAAIPIMQIRSVMMSLKSGKN